jgi:toxin CptA
MDVMIRSLAFIAAGACAAVMGFAIQRGATCTVAAVDELVNQRKAARLVALVEASLWVCGGLLVAQRLSLLAQMPAGYALTLRTLAGAVLLGLGAFVNRACVFGAIARFGSGEWVFALTPVGFYLGSLAAGALVAPSPPQRLEGGSVVFFAPAAIVWLMAAALAWRVGAACVRGRTAWRALVSDKLWSPHAATCVIGVAFVALLLLAGAWSYTDALADLARGMTRGLPVRLLLGACLLAGAVVGGWTAGRFRPMRIGGAALLRCLAGGAMMGSGSLLIPGGNDGLILVGMPMLWPYAWAAFLAMCVSIALAQWAQSRLAARWRAPLRPT